MNPNQYADFIWNIKEYLRDDYAEKEYEDVILPFTLLRRIDCVLEKTHDAVMSTFEKYKHAPKSTVDALLIAEIPELPGVMKYGKTREEAAISVKSLALRVLADRLEHGENIPNMEQFMQALQFEIKSTNGTESEIKDDDKSELMKFFGQFNADLTGYKFNRDEANCSDHA